MTVTLKTKNIIVKYGRQINVQENNVDYYRNNVNNKFKKLQKYSRIGNVNVHITIASVIKRK